MLSRRTVLLAAWTLASAHAFSTPSARPSSTRLHQSADAWSDTSASGGGAGSIEQIEFKIHPDGRIEETVRGVKGNNCHKVTEKINQALGEVVSSTPTEEMFEQELTIKETLYNTESSSSDWEGSSSW